MVLLKNSSFSHLPGALLRGCALTHTGVHSCTHSHTCTHIHTLTACFAASALEEMREVLLNDFPLQNVSAIVGMMLLNQ